MNDTGDAGGENQLKRTSQSVSLKSFWPQSLTRRSRQPRQSRNSSLLQRWRWCAQPLKRSSRKLKYWKDLAMVARMKAIQLEWLPQGKYSVASPSRMPSRSWPSEGRASFSPSSGTGSWAARMWITNMTILQRKYFLGNFSRWITSVCRKSASVKPRSTYLNELATSEISLLIRMPFSSSMVFRAESRPCMSISRQRRQLPVPSFCSPPPSLILATCPRQQARQDSNLQSRQNSSQMTWQASMFSRRCALRQYSQSPSWQKSEYSSEVLGWNSPKLFTASSSAALRMSSSSKTGAQSRWKATWSGCVSGRAKLRSAMPAAKLCGDLLVRQQGRSMGWSWFLRAGFSRNSWQLLSLASAELVSQPIVCANSSSIFSSRGLTSRKSSKSSFSSSDGALRNSFWISKEGKSNVFSLTQNYTSLSSRNGAADTNSGTPTVNGTEMPQCQRTALSRQPGFTGGGKTEATLKQSAHFSRMMFQNWRVSSPLPKTRLRQSSAKARQRSCPSARRSASSSRYSLELRAGCWPAGRSSARSASACRNSFLMVLASTSARTISRTQGRVVFSQRRCRQRTLMPISCSVVLMEQLSTKSSSRLCRRSSSSGIQQLSMSRLASIAFRSSARLNSSPADETRKAWLSSWQFSSLVQSRQKATISGRRRASGLSAVRWKLQSTGKTMPGLRRQQKLGSVTWSCVLSFLKLYSKTLRELPRGASTLRLASSSKGSLLTLSTSSMTSSASLRRPISCRSPSDARRLQTSVFSSSEKGMSHITSSFTPLNSSSDMSGSRTLQPRTSRSVKRMSLMLQFTMNSWFSSFPPRFTHSPLQYRHPSNSRPPSPNPHTTSSTYPSAIRLAALLKNSISCSRTSSRSSLSARGALGSSRITCSQYLQQSRQKAEMVKDSCTS